MPLFIRDDQVDDLASRLQAMTGARTKTEAVRLALEHEHSLGARLACEHRGPAADRPGAHDHDVRALTLHRLRTLPRARRTDPR